MWGASIISERSFVGEAKDDHACLFKQSQQLRQLNSYIHRLLPLASPTLVRVFIYTRLKHTLAFSSIPIAPPIDQLEKRIGTMARGSSVHVRSASVPCHSHPVVTQVEDQLAALRSWSCNPGQNRMSLAHVRALLCLLDELLLLHHQSSGTSHAEVELLLDGFLVLADAFGSFLAALLALRQYAAELRAAVRRHEHHKASAAARAQRQVGKEIQQLAAALTRSATSGTPLMDVVSRTVAEAINHTAVASASVFVEVAALADAAAALAASPSSSSTSNKKHKHRLPNLVVNASEKLQELDQCVAELESESEKVFRSLVQTRVSLLNIHTPTF